MSGYDTQVPRYLVDFDPGTMEKEYRDILIIGSGIAGVYTALEIPGEFDVAILTKESIDISNSALAQGGIAVSLGKTDSPELHFRDTIYAGAWLCDEDSVWVLVNEAAANIKEICRFGVNFDRSGPEELSLTREAAHSKNRIIHAGDTTGKEVCDKLISVVRTRKNVTIHEQTSAVDLLLEDGECRGILAYDERTGKLRLVLANMVVCATGGYGQLYSYTTNPEVATGDGAGLAYRAGASLMDMEFIQFHPTVLYHPENKSFLISEAVRGEGALLRNADGKRFMPEYHELCELAPRDVVSRAIFAEMQKTGTDHMYLDITFKDREWLENRFPNIFKTCLGYGIDISRDYIPVAPAEHYCMGGIRTDVYGRTGIPGFYACGESACTGLHGANRLASNSLLEGLVFGRRIGIEAAERMKEKGPGKGVVFNGNREKPAIARRRKDFDRAAVRKDVQETMTSLVGITRSREGLLLAGRKLNDYAALLSDLYNEDGRDYELQNIVLLARLVVDSALSREESRGAHYRSDFPRPDEIKWRRNIIQKRGSV